MWTCRLLLMLGKCLSISLHRYVDQIVVFTNDRLFDLKVGVAILAAVIVEHVAAYRSAWEFRHTTV